MNRPAVGLKRDALLCGQCSEPLSKSLWPNSSVKAKRKVCAFCNSWIHYDEDTHFHCYRNHMYGHIKGILCRGIRRRQQQKALSKAQFEKNESAKKAERERIARETGAASSSSSQSRAPCPRPDADAVSVPVSSQTMILCRRFMIVAPAMLNMQC